jgi:D-sedoheptulose 7-phosphate isomerase
MRMADAALKASTRKHLAIFSERNPRLSNFADSIGRAVAMICGCAHSGGKVLTCGNGGSASDSEHIAAELMKSFILPRPIPAGEIQKLKDSGIAGAAELAPKLQRAVATVALTSNAAIMTAIANDTDAQMIFAQQLYALGRAGDVLIGLSTSGNSGNVVNALKLARVFGLKTIGFTGSKSAAMDALCDVLFKVPETETYKIQECHFPIYHTLCLAIEEEMFGAE